MNWFHKLLANWQFNRRKIDASSLQFRLTVGIATSALLGLGGFAVGTTWNVQQMAHKSHIEDVNAIAKRFAQELAVQPPMQLTATELQDFIDRQSMFDLWLWVKDSKGAIVAQSQFLEPEIRDDITSLAQTAPSQTSSPPQVSLIQGQYIAWCRFSVLLNGQSSQLYVVRDVTRDYQMLVAFRRNLAIGGFLTAIAFVGLSALLISRFLTPIRQTAFLASSQATHRLDNIRLDPDQSPIEIKELVLTCNQLSAQIFRTGEQQRQFTRGVSHELRTPLSVVYGYLQSMLKRSTNLTTQQREALEIATTETERTIQLLQDLLDLSRVDCQLIHFNLQPVVLSDLIATVIQTQARYVQRVSAIQTEQEPLVAIADRHYLEQALTHLIDNALQFSEDDQPIRIDLSLQTDLEQTASDDPEQIRQWVLISVIDQGCGIPESQLTQIFEPFYRIDPSRNRATGGVGLGLAIAKASLEGMGGHISVRSSLGRGSTFTVKLPAA
jgi:signal transduction histidine kinase